MATKLEVYDGLTEQSVRRFSINSNLDVTITNSLSPLAVPGAKPTLPISAGKKPFDNAFIAEAGKKWSNFHMQMGRDHALYSTDHLSGFLTMAVAPPVGELSRLQRNPVKKVGKATFVRGDGSRRSRWRSML